MYCHTSVLETLDNHGSFTGADHLLRISARGVCGYSESCDVGVFFGRSQSVL